MYTALGNLYLVSNAQYVGILLLKEIDMLMDQKLKRALQRGHVSLTLDEGDEEEGSCYDWEEDYDLDWIMSLEPEPEYLEYPEDAFDEPHYESYCNYDDHYPSPLEQVGYDEDRDLAHEADMRALMREQLRADISPEEAEEECRLRDEQDDGYDYDRYY